MSGNGERLMYFRDRVREAAYQFVGDSAVAIFYESPVGDYASALNVDMSSRGLSTRLYEFERNPSGLTGFKAKKTRGRKVIVVDTRHDQAAIDCLSKLTANYYESDPGRLTDILYLTALEDREPEVILSPRHLIEKATAKS